jgi:hypothetical protein
MTKAEEKAERERLARARAQYKREVRKRDELYPADDEGPRHISQGMLWAAVRLLPALPACPADKRIRCPIPASNDELDQQVDTDRPVRVLDYDPMELIDGKA